MNRLHPLTLLLILLGAVPPVVAGSGLVSFVLLRAGYGLVVGLLVPFAASLLLVAVVGLLLGRAARGPRGATPRPRDRGEDDV